ncbi:MAG: DUF262 domain-containing protein [Bacteroidia bacterium]
MKTLEENNIAEEQILKEKVPVDYDTREFTVEHIIDMFEKGEYKIPPYQREFVWDLDKQSKFIESIILDLPIPYIFFADDKTDGKLEIVDGSQRIRTLVSFKNNTLKLVGLEKLDELNGFVFSDLLESRQRRILRKTLRSVELTEKADFETKKDIFQRINTDPYDLSDMEIRKGIYQEGKFYSFIKDCSEFSLFIDLCPVAEKRKKRGELQELVLRYFAYSEKFKKFVHRVDVFLDEYIKDKHENGYDEEISKQEFKKMLNFVSEYFPTGFKKTDTSKTIARVRFEAISVGVTLALREKPDLIPIDTSEWINGEAFLKHTTTDAANNRLKVVGRIEFVKNKLLGYE